MELQNEKAGIMTTGTDEVQELAQNLDDWAQRELPEKQQTLLLQLLSRCENRETEKQIDIGEPTYAYKTDIKQAAMDALRTIDRAGDPNFDSNPRGNDWAKWANGQIWPRS